MTHFGVRSLFLLLILLTATCGSFATPASSLLAGEQDLGIDKKAPEKKISGERGPLSSVVKWDFESGDMVSLRSQGKVEHGQAGPRPPEFPGMVAGNQAVRLGTADYLVVEDPGTNSVFDFSNGDDVTIEAWVNPSGLREGQVSYVVGKGRTGSPSFAPDNQNWSLRLIGAGNQAKISFLFATRHSRGDDHWHRWDSKSAFPVGTGWHHIAVTYRFGSPGSIRGWINGQPVKGSWSYGGETTEPPIVDNDEIRIGNGFAGMLDRIAIHRDRLDDRVIASRFHRVGRKRTVESQPEVMPRLAAFPEGRVLVQLSAGLAAANRWPNTGEKWPDESVRWTGNWFLLPRIPLNYDAWGIRSAWTDPVLLRMAGNVSLPAGKQRFMIRGRALGRLWINGRVVARTKAITGRPPDGEERITPIAEPPLPGVRVHGYRQQEVFGETTIEAGPDGLSRIVLELIVGGKGHRTETGEVCVAVLAEDGKSWQVLGSDARRLPLTDVAVNPALSAIEQSLRCFDDQRRRNAAASREDFWRKRHERAKALVKANPAPSPPQGAHPIDAFIRSRIEQAIHASTASEGRQAEQFHGKILPVLRQNCFRCHGEKTRGGLKLDSRAAALAPGDSEHPAVVPGKPQTSELMLRIRSGDMPPGEKRLPPQQIALLEQWISEGAAWPDPPLLESEVKGSPVIDDAPFLRRVFLDTVGVPPTAGEARAFLTDQSPGKRTRLINQLLQDERLADGWMGFWLDLLAENPTLLNQSMGSTGPFRWFLHDALRDNQPLDRMVTQLLMMRGSSADGGSAGFAKASENDSPMAAKGHIVASAFLGIELQCARCHDSPYHSTTQEDLYSLAAMLSRKPVTVPVTSRVPAAFFENQKIRKSLIEVTLKANQPVMPQWPFAAITGVQDNSQIDSLMQNPKDTRERLAALITAPQNRRFSRVLANRVWKRLIGAGLVEPAHDWEGATASHPMLLDWLAQELVANQYDFRHLLRTILTSKTYQRAAVGKNRLSAAGRRFFNGPQRRRLTAEQVVDSLHHATGRAFDVEELTFVHDGRRELGQRQTLGKPTRAWMFGDLKNERDRPSLSLPRARAVVDVLEAFGWTGARQMPVHNRETDPNLLQPAVLSNSTLTRSLTRVSQGSALAALALSAKTPESLVETLFLQTLGRFPKPDEQQVFSSVLAAGFETRIIPPDRISPVKPLPRLPQVTWFNHGRPKANEIQLEIERRVLAGPPHDTRLTPEWRSALQDVMWSLINHREFVWIP
ncbi:MAG: DUF1553 domain-containing protein [Planctomycetota bacterium]|nr:DUF1553 domain-containing protein [Planctomycetota bacterium]